MDIVIEKLKRQDLKEAISIYDENHNLKTNFDELIKRFQKIDENPAYLNIVAKLDKKIVGFATVIVNYDIVEELKPFVTVWNFGIRKEFRRKRIGTQMFNYIYDFAKKNEYSFISLIADSKNTVAQAFYESLGYKKEIGYVKLIDTI